MNAHTPGPWVLVWHEQNKQGRIGQWLIGPAGGIPAAHSRRATEKNPRVLANARLITAAPDMLAALGMLLVAAKADGWPPGWGLVQEHAEAAIAKAEGKS